MKGGGHRETWTPAMMVRLHELHAEELSFGQIANRLNVEFGTSVTRNACVGKGRRAQLPPRKAPPMLTSDQRKQQTRIERRRAKAEKRIPPPPPTYVPLPEPERPPPDALTIFDLQYGDCRWPVHGEKMDMLYCGRPKVRGSYCFKHARLSAGGKGQ
jgi:hypothetical protein